MVDIKARSLGLAVVGSLCGAFVSADEAPTLVERFEAVAETEFLATGTGELIIVRTDLSGDGLEEILIASNQDWAAGQVPFHVYTPLTPGYGDYRYLGSLVSAPDLIRAAPNSKSLEALVATGGHRGLAIMRLRFEGTDSRWERETLEVTATRESDAASASSTSPTNESGVSMLDEFRRSNAAWRQRSDVVFANIQLSEFRSAQKPQTNQEVASAPEDEPEMAKGVPYDALRGVVRGTP